MAVPETLANAVQLLAPGTVEEWKGGGVTRVDGVTEGRELDSVVNVRLSGKVLHTKKRLSGLTRLPLVAEPPGHVRSEGRPPLAKPRDGGRHWVVGGDRLGERFQLGEAAYPFGRRVAGAVACHEVDSFGLGEGGISGVRVGATRRRGSEVGRRLGQTQHGVGY